MIAGGISPSNTHCHGASVLRKNSNIWERF
jgi:hypothetical protein